jgi:hypothetical protein
MSDKTDKAAADFKTARTKLAASAALKLMSPEDATRGRELVAKLATLLPDAEHRQEVTATVFAIVEIAAKVKRQVEDQIHQPAPAVGLDAKLAEIVALLRQPVIPVRDGNGKVVGAQRVETLPKGGTP